MGRVTLEKEVGKVATVLRDEALDPIADIWSPGEQPHAEVGISVGKSVGFGAVRINVHVSLECNQTERHLDQAAALAFKKAVEYACDGMRMLLEEKGE